MTGSGSTPTWCMSWHACGEGRSATAAICCRQRWPSADTASPAADHRRRPGGLLPGPAIAFVGDVRGIRHRVPRAARARTDDGLLDVCVLPCTGAWTWPAGSCWPPPRSMLAKKGAVYLQARHVLVESPEAVPVQVDGEFRHTPVELDLLPSKLEFFVP